ncbi:MAG: glucosaminidase domain-containing protein [Prevotella sp.]|nr:glucosaminidase domain-containing protein [Prevotella sp.]
MMKKQILLLCLLAVMPLVGLMAQSRWNARYQAYVDQYRDIAISQMQRYHIPASITLAQGLLESGAGHSLLAREANNHFGIKCHSDWKGATMQFDDDELDECFRSYKNSQESYEDHSRFLSSGQRYRSLFSLKLTDYKGWARGLKAAGYATNPHYANLLIELIETYKLYDYDEGYVADRSDELGIDVYEFNDNLYVLARRGDTFRTLGELLGISYKKLASYNERERDDQLEEGEIIWLKKKARKAPKEYRDRPHTVQPGESMYSIAQYYGIRLERLYKLNDLSPDYDIQVGDQLQLR